MINISLPLKPREELERAYGEAEIRYEGILASLVSEIRQEIRARGINVTVRYRVKSFSSWYGKLLKSAAAPGSGIHQVSLTDVLGIRVVCPFMEEVSLVSSLLEDLFSVEEIDIKGADYPYQYFGYESVHFLIGIPIDLIGVDFSPEITPSRVCEVQVRTILQEAWAEVEHELIYKSDFSPLDEPLKRKLAALNANLTLSDIMFQEIRDYQKSLHNELRKRRKGFYDTIRRNQGSKDDALSGGEGVSLSPKSAETVDTLLLQGLLAHNEKDYTRAIETYTVILSKSSRKDIRTVIFLHRGMAYFSSGRETEALADFNSALDLDPNNTKALYYRAVNARMNGEYLKAFSDIAICLEKDPYNLEFLTARGETHSSAGNKEAAREDFHAALSIEPDFKPALRLLTELDGNSP